MKSKPLLLAMLAMPSVVFPIQGIGAPADSPLFLTSRVTPNIFFEVDDSGSMDWTITTKKYWGACAYDPDYGSTTDASSDCESTPRDDGNFYSYDDNNNRSDTFYYVYDSSDDVYSNGCGASYPAVENCSSGKLPWDTDWRVKSAAVNVLYYDPSVAYAPWPGKTDASFTLARSNPELDEAGYTSTRNLTGLSYEVAVDDSGFSGDRPRRGTNTNKTGTANGWIDLWDAHTRYTFNASDVTVTRYVYDNIDKTSPGLALQPTVTVSTLSGTGCYPELGGGTVETCRTVEQAKQNFANWYQYHRRRSFVTKAAISQVITDSPNYRYGLSLINDYSGLFVEMPAASTTDYTSHNSDLISKFFKHNWAANGTPLRNGLKRTGQYYQGTLSSHPTSPITLSCQKNFTVLFTDGYWNESMTFANSDGDAYSNTLADVAHYYYKTDLSSTLPNNVPTTTFDTAEHQHMVTFGVSFGVQGKLVAGSDGWPSPVKTEASDWGDPNPSGNDPEKIDDLWHASYNSRGSFVAAQSPSEVVEALTDALGAIEESLGSASSAATSSTSLDTGARVFQAKFDQKGWTGQLLSFGISTGGAIAATEDWDASKKINTQVGDTTELAEPGSTTDGRVIITKGSTDGVAFSYDNLSGPTTTAGTQKNLLDKAGAGTTDGRGADRVGYLRGHSQYEGSTVGTFRQRLTTVLGDIANSNPWYVGAPSAGYSDVDHPGYSGFRSAYLDRKPVVYVGANDGMLHGFDASFVKSGEVYLPTADSGKEVLGYVPTPVYPNLSRLTEQNYNANHRYFVDGSPMVADACVGSCGGASATWKSVLVGSLGAGGKGYFALDVTNPAGFSEAPANAASTLLWEFTNSDDADLGLTYNYPASHPTTQQAKQIVKMENGKWAVILGNGYYSTNGKAVLYILFLENGEDGNWSGAGDFVKIVADSGTGNGLSTPTPFDSDGNGKADTIYAGDLKGDMWKFDVSSSSSTASWAVAFSGAPLYVAQDASSNRQPIIAPPEVTLHPKGGRMVLFGTGKYMETTDNASTSTQSFYGIWDNGSAVGGRSDLDEKLIELDGANRTVKAGATRASPKGWYVDLPTSGERVTGIPKLRNGLIIYNTFMPNASPCADFKSAGWLMAHDYLAGGLPPFPVFDSDGDGDIDEFDVPVAGLSVGAAIGGTTLISGAEGSTIGAGVSSRTDGSTGSDLFNFGGGSRGRITWREIVQ